jgi:hypothetical protein
MVAGKLHLGALGIGLSFEALKAYGWLYPINFTPQLRTAFLPAIAQWSA